MESLLKGYYVLELAGVYAGPAAGQFLAECGASVIKIENLKTAGDVTRRWKLPSEPTDTDISAYYSAMNWGKESLAIDLSLPQSRTIIYRILEKTDIVISSYKKGDDKKFGLDEQTLRKIKPDIIYAHISGYGADNPKVAYDAVLQAESGLMGMNGTGASGPLKIPLPVIDIMAAHQLKEGILLGIISRMKTGLGRSIEVSLADAAVAALSNQAMNYLYTHEIPGLMGSLHPTIAPYGETFETKDNRYAILAIGTDKQFAELCTILGIQAVAEDEKFKTNAARLLNRESLDQILSNKIREHQSNELMEKMTEHHIPGGLVQNIGEVMDRFPHLTFQHKKLFGIRQNVFLPPPENMSPPQHTGAQSEEVLQAAGFSPQEIAEYRSKNIIP